MSLRTLSDDTAALAHTQAMLADQKQYSTGQPCKRGHMSPRFVSGRTCVQCQRELIQARRKAAALQCEAIAA